MSFENIPAELRALNQWVLWREEFNPNGKNKKPPICPHNGIVCAATDTSAFGSFEQCMRALMWAKENRPGERYGLNFVLTGNDPYAIIDLDATEDVHQQALQAQVLRRFKSYVEYSPSGKGFHVVCKTGYNFEGRRLGAVEMYSKDRTMSFTGSVYGPEFKPILDETETLRSLYEHIEAARPKKIITPREDKPQVLEDEQVYDIAAMAANGSKFVDLYNGYWENHVKGSQSEADFALINIIAHYTDNREQVTRMFHASQLGKRDKAFRESYLNDMLERAWDNKAPPLDLDINAIQANMVRSHQPTIPPPQVQQQRRSDPINSIIEDVHLRFSDSESAAICPQKNSSIEHPPGAMGRLTRKVQAMTHQRSLESAVIHAFATIAGIAGRAFHVNGVGLNLYTLLLGLSGSGKTTGAEACQDLMHLVDKDDPEGTTKLCDFLVKSRYTGTGAILQALGKKHSFVTFWPEFGQSMAGYKNNSPSAKEISTTLCDVFTSCKPDRTASNLTYSKAENNIKDVKMPALSVAAESTPSAFYNSFSAASVEAGLIPRFWFMEMAEQTEVRELPPPDKSRDYELECMLRNLGHVAKVNGDTNAPTPVRMSQAAQQFAERYRYRQDALRIYYNKKGENFGTPFTRTYENMLTVASLMAALDNPNMPTIKTEYLIWAGREMERSAFKINKGLSNGEFSYDIYSGVSIDYKSDVMDKIRKYIEVGPSQSFYQLASYTRGLREINLIPYLYLTQELRKTKKFKLGKGISHNVDTALKELIGDGLLAQLSPRELGELGLKSQAKIYKILEL